MKLVVGLGNPGVKYAWTPHNAGFHMIDRIVEKIGGRWKEDTKLEGYIVEDTLNETIYLKPLTYMNLSGKSVLKALKRFKIPYENVLLIHDDLDLELGKYKMNDMKSPKKHNGVTSVEDTLRFKEFKRIRIGVDNRQEKIQGDIYVIRKYSPEERETLQSVIQEITTKYFEQ